MKFIFLNFWQKVFDKVSHSLIIHNLSKVNIDLNAFNWTVSFLTYRSQIVAYNSINSTLTSVSSGIPQGQTCARYFKKVVNYSYNYWA